MKIKLALAASLVFLPACMSTRVHNLMVENVKKDCEIKVRDVMLQAQSIIGPQRERLQRLGQIDKNGNLKPEK